MIKKIFLIFFLFCISCSSDDIIRSEKTSFYNIYKNLIIKEQQPTVSKVSKKEFSNNRRWLSKFKQPIILLSSLDGSNQATLVALGNYKNKMTWVSSDGISVSFEDGILIATRGYSQDLIESEHGNLNKLFDLSSKRREKTYRYLSGENGYEELKFSCTISVKKNTTPHILSDIKLKTTELTEICVSEISSHTNLYYLLPDTKIVLKSKQWVSQTNGYILCYNYYAFQDNLY